MPETWLPIPDYEGLYEVSDLGRVRSLDREVECLNRWGGTTIRKYKGVVLTPRPDQHNRHRVQLSRPCPSEKAEFFIHHLVLTAFVGPRPDDMQCCHWDDDSANNALSNIRWDTRSANMRDMVRNGRHNFASRTHCPSGHEYSPVNTRIGRNGGRWCRACARESHRQSWHRNREANNAKARERYHQKRLMEVVSR